MPLRPEIKTLWVNALTSGKYKQNRGKLKNNDSYCCLGVLCNVYKQRRHKGGWMDSKVFANETSFVPDSKLETESIYALPEPVAKWAGFDIKNVNGEASEANKVQNILVDMNDHDRLSFDQIATFIENNL